MRRKQKKEKTAIKTTLITITAIILSLLIAEGLVRTFSPVQTQIWKQIYTYYHEPITNVKTQIIDDNNGEFKNNYFTNTEGLYNKEIPIKKRNGEFRILTIGDSFANAAHTTFEKTNHRLLEKKLQKSYGKNITVINGGIGGTGTSQQLVYLKRKLLRYKPDAIILYFYLNDVEDNLIRSPLRIANGKLIENFTPTHSTGQNLREWLGIHSQLYVLFWKVIVANEKSIPFFSKIGIIKTSYTKKEDSRYKVHFNILRNKSSNSMKVENEIQTGWKVTELAIKEIANISKQNNASFFVVIIPYKEQVDQGKLLQLLDSENWNSSDVDLERPQKTIKKILELQKIAYLDLLPPFRNNNVNNSFYFNIDTHWTVQGEALAAQEVYNSKIIYIKQNENRGNKKGI